VRTQLELNNIAFTRQTIYENLVHGKISTDEAKIQLTKLQLLETQIGSETKLPSRFPDRSGLEQYIELESKRG
jgi:hypothetical protein